MKTKMHSKAILALLLSVVMVLSMIPATALPVNAVEEVEEGGITYLINNDFDSADELSATYSSGSWTTKAGEVITVDGLSVFNLNQGQLIYSFGEAITGDYVIKFKYKLDGYKTDGTAISGTAETGCFYAGSAGNQAGSSVFLKFYGETRTQYVDRVEFNNKAASSSLMIDGSTVRCQWHEVEIHVDQTNKQYTLYTDGASVRTIGYYADNATSLIRFHEETSGYNMSIDYVQVYTEDWTVAQSAQLGENIHMTFSGNVSSVSGITGVRATMGGTTLPATLTDGAYSVTVPVAAAQMGETITLEAMEGDTVKYRRAYTVEDYLNAVKDTEGYSDIVNHTLNYGSAAAAYFNGTAVTAPSLTLADVPSARKGDYITVNDNNAGTSTNYVELSYKLATAITENYTVEFDYYLPNVYSSVYVWIGPSAKDGSNMGIRLQPNQQEAIYYTNHNTYYDANPTGNTYNTVAVWHTFKVTVNSTNKTFNVWLDGTQITNGTTADFTCISQSNIALSCVAIDVYSDTGRVRQVMIDNLKIYRGDGSGEPYYSDNFETFETVTSGEGWYEYTNGDTTEVAVLNYQDLENPVSGNCTGVTVNSANLLFEDQVKVRYKITLDAGESIDNYTVLVDGEEPAKVVSAGNNTYYVYSEGINPQMYDTDVVLTVSKGDEAVTVNYSPLDYIKRMSEKESTAEALRTLLKAMYNYHLVAKEFVTSAA